MNTGSHIDDYGNYIEWKSEPDHGFLEIHVEGEEVAFWAYDDSPEESFKYFMKIWNTAQKLAVNPNNPQAQGE